MVQGTAEVKPKSLELFLFLQTPQISLLAVQKPWQLWA